MNLHNLLSAQRAAFLAGPLPTQTERRQQLMHLKRSLLNHKEGLAAAESRDFGGHSLDEVMIAEMFPLIEGLNAAIKHVGRWMKASRRRVGLPMLPSSARVFYQPLGVIGVVTPWNYPLLLSIGPLINIIAAGNRAMIKMSEHTPETAQVLRTMLAEVFPAEQVAVVVDNTGALGEE